MVFHAVRAHGYRRDLRRGRKVRERLAGWSAVTALSVLLTGYGVGVVAGLVAWMVRRGVNS